MINNNMDATNNISTDLFYKIRSRFTGLKLGESTGQITINPENARFFDFDYMENDKNIGHVSISLAEPNSMKVYFSSGITEGMDQDQKGNWYAFLKELRMFAKRRLLAFDTRDIAKDNLDKRDYAFLSQHSTPQSDNDTITKPVGEAVMNESNLYGTKTQSFQKLEDTRLIIKHSKKLADDFEQKPGDRSRNISALFVENQDGERFKYPFIHLAGARAMQRHVANGGAPYDAIGESIIKMSEEIAQLKSFTGYVVRNDLMNSDTNSVVERSKGQLDSLRERIAKIAKQAHYESYVESFQAPEAMEVPDDVMEQFKDQFTVRNFKEDLTSVFPVLYRLMKEDEIVGYDDIVEMTKTESDKYHCKDCGDVMHKPTTDCNHDSHDENGSHWVDNNGNGINDMDESSDPFAAFENWAMALGEDSPLTAGSDEEIKEAVASLNELVNQDFPVGVDGTNAIQSLKGIIEDNRLFNDIKMKAKEDPKAPQQDAVASSTARANSIIRDSTRAAAEPDTKKRVSFQAGAKSEVVPISPEGRGRSTSGSRRRSERSSSDEGRKSRSSRHDAQTAGAANARTGRETERPEAPTEPPRDLPGVSPQGPLTLLNDGGPAAPPGKKTRSPGKAEGIQRRMNSIAEGQEGKSASRTSLLAPTTPTNAVPSSGDVLIVDTEQVCEGREKRDEKKRGQEPSEPLSPESRRPNAVFFGWYKLIRVATSSPKLGIWQWGSI